MGKRRHYSILDIVMFLILGSVFIALGIGVLIAVISSVIGTDKSNIKIAIAVPIILFGLLPIAMGSIPFGMAVKQIYHIARARKANKYGIANTARIIDYKKVSHNGKLNRRFALKLAII